MPNALCPVCHCRVCDCMTARAIGRARVATLTTAEREARAVREQASAATNAARAERREQKRSRPARPLGHASPARRSDASFPAQAQRAR